MPLTDEELLVQLSARRAARSERIQVRSRSYSREASIASMVLCMVGLVGLMVCVVGNFNLQVASSENFEVTHVGGKTWAIMRQGYDLTTLFAGIGAAGFASALIVCGGAFGQIKRMPQGAAYAVGMSAIVSSVGLLVLAVVS